MTKRMLVDATHPEETRVAIVNSYRDTNRLEDLDFSLASKPILRGNIYLAKVMRIEPSLQAAFVEYGGNRHGFLPFNEIHPDYFRIPIADRAHDGGPVMEETADEAGADEIPAGNGGEEVQEQPGGEMTGANELASAVYEGSEPDAFPSTEDSPQEHLSLFSDTGIHEGLITDFGNALVPEASPVESVGGDLAEKVVRRHRLRYKIQEVIKRGQVMLVQVVKEERGNKGAALTTFLSLAGRYCVLMPNTDHGGGVSRKITNHQDRRRMKEILDQLEVPEGMAVILRTAGMEQEPPEIQRDLDYLLRLWDSIREQTLRSTAPALIYEEANLIKRSVRDLFSRDISEILVAGAEGYNKAREFMSALMPDQVDKIKLYQEDIPLFFRYNVESQIDRLHNPIVQLRSGGYIVINPTEALVAIDVNSGRATRERHIEETALKTNLEAADEIARQLRLRDLAGLIVIDFIDMEDGRNNAAVERRLKEAMKSDRARLQIGRISPFGLMELSRQRLRPSLLEINFGKCPHCAGTGYVRSTDSAALSVLRAIEEEGIRQRGGDLVMHVPTNVALYIFNHKRAALRNIEERYDLHVSLLGDDSLVPPDFRLERSRQRSGERKISPAVNADRVLAGTEREFHEISDIEDRSEDSGPEAEEENAAENSGEETRDKGFRRRFRRSRRDYERNGKTELSPDRLIKEDRWSAGINEGSGISSAVDTEGGILPEEEPASASPFSPEEHDAPITSRRRRGRRGGRRRSGNGNFKNNGENRRFPRRRTRSGPDYVPEAGVESFGVPVSIHELDTTPRADDTSPAAAPVPHARPAHEEREEREEHEEKDKSAPKAGAAEARETSPYEIVNPPSDKPKAGWWRRLTGV